MTPKAMLAAVLEHSKDESLALQAMTLLRHTDEAIEGGLPGIISRAALAPEDYPPAIAKAFTAFEARRMAEREENRTARLSVRATRNEIAMWQMLADRHTGGDKSDLIRRALEMVYKHGLKD